MATQKILIICGCRSKNWSFGKISLPLTSGSRVKINRLSMTTVGHTDFLSLYSNNLLSTKSKVDVSDKNECKWNIGRRNSSNFWNLHFRGISIKIGNEKKLFSNFSRSKIFIVVTFKKKSLILARWEPWGGKEKAKAE